jgi:prepilin-type N-terminal cleavage/methylation domain-containing protein
MDRRRRAPQAGFTLIEILITVALLGGVMTVMLSAVSASSRISDIGLKQAQTESAARRVAEYLRSSAVPLRCDGDLKVNYQTDVNSITLPAGVVSPATVTAVAWGGSYTGDTPNWSGSQTCSGATPYFERISVKVTTSGTPSVSATVTVLKRDLTKG